MKTLAPLAAFALLCALLGDHARFMLPLGIVALGMIVWMREEKY